MRLREKVCIITGAGGGMGRVAAERFAAEGARVVAADIDAAAAEAAVASIRAAGGEATAVVADVAREADCRAIVEAALAAYGKLDVLYNNAGVFLAEDGSVTGADEAVWDRTLAVNLKGTAFCAKYAIPAMIRGGGGSVINVGSFVALLGCSVPQDAYTASKGAVIALTRSLAVQFGPHGVRVNFICPGAVETPMLTKWLVTQPGERDRRVARYPLGRLGRSDDVVGMALYLASDESRWTTGATLCVDGGVTVNYF